MAYRRAGRKAKGLGKFLSKPAGSIIALGPLSFLAGLSLWIVIPMLLVGMAVTTVVVWTLIPFFVAAIVMLITYAILSYFGMREPWRHALPVIFGLIALTPTFMDWAQQAVSSSITVTAATKAQAVQAQGLLGDMLEKIAQGPLAFSVFAVLMFLAIGLASLVRLGSVAAFVAGFLALALGFGLALNVAGLSGKALMGLAEPKAELTVTDLKMSGWKTSVYKTGWTAKNDRWWDGKTTWKATLSDFDSVDTKRKEKELDGRIKYMDWIWYEAKFTVQEVDWSARDPDMGDPPAETTFLFTPAAKGFEGTKVSATRISGELGWVAGGFQDGTFTLTTAGTADSGVHKAKIEITAYREETRSKEEPAPERPVITPSKTSTFKGVPWYVYIFGLSLIAVPVCVYTYEEAQKP